jgi:hypothetical protein
VVKPAEAVATSPQVTVEKKSKTESKKQPLK